MIEKIIDNLKINLKNVHVRFEEKKSFFNKYTFGIQIESIKLYNDSLEYFNRSVNSFIEMKKNL